jgi:hypothetical protein
MRVQEVFGSLQLKTRPHCFWKQLALACVAAVAINAFAAASITVSNPQALAFGKFAAGSGGTVTIGPSGARSHGGSVVLLPSAGGSAAQFGVSGEPSTSYAITLPANGTVHLASGANSMAVNSFSSSPNAVGQLSLGGSQTLSIGATLNVAGNQPPGNYSGSFNVSIDYN